MLDWAAYDPAKVERVAKILVREACGATGIDGSGGDKAQDLRHDGPDGLTIYEVKSFTKRLQTKQKQQITASLTRAVDLHTPVRWILVIPLDPSPAELEWFDRLKGRFPDVVLEWFGIDWLDGKVAGREDLISYVEGANYTLARRAQQMGMEREALTTGADFLARMEDLRALGNTITPYWRWESTGTPWGPAHMFTAQRPDAPVEDPVQLTPTFSFPPDDAEAQAAARELDRVLRRGGDVEISGRFIEQFEVTAASEATQRLLGEPVQQVGSLRLISIPNTDGLPRHGSLVLERGGDDLLSVPFALKERVSGHDGATITGSDPSGLLEGRLEMSRAGAPDSQLTLSLRPLAGSYPHDALPGLRLLAACQDGDRLHFRLGPVPFLSFDAGSAAPPDIVALHQLVAALEVLQAHLEQLLPIPEQAPDAQHMRELLAMAGALSGTSSPLPYDGFHAPLRPGRLRTFLDLVPLEPGGIYAAPEAFTLTLDDQDYEVTGLAMWAPQVVLANRDELEAHTHGDTEAVARFTIAGDSPIVMIRAVDELGPQFRSVVEQPRSL